MKRIDAKRVEHDFQRKEFANVSLNSRPAESNTILCVDEQPILLHCPIEAPGEIADHLKRRLVEFDGWQGTAKRGNEYRLSGIKSKHRTFGFVAPSPLRKRFCCSISHFNLAWPTEAGLLDELALCAWRQFQRLLPEVAESHLRVIDGILPDWRLASGMAPWTSGIINDGAALPYHKDAGNVKGSWSAMVVFRSMRAGGYLHVPGLDTLLSCDDLSLSIFDGQGELHGVTPINRRSRDGGYRYSIVFYAKSGMVGAGSAAEELRKAQVRASQ